MKINPKILKILESKYKEYDSCETFVRQEYKNLLLVHYGIFTGDQIIEDLLELDLLVKDFKTNTYVSKYPLDDFEEIDDEFIESYRNLFNNQYGKSLKTGIKGDPKTIHKNFKKFFKEFKKYNPTKELILEITANYIREKVINGNIKFISNADYFIYKDGVSLLGNLLSDKENIDNSSQQDHFKKVL